MIKSTILAAAIALATLAAPTGAKADDFSVTLGIEAGQIHGVGGWNDGRWENGGWSDRWERPRYHDELISPRRVHRILRRSGFSDVGAIRLRGPNYVVEAVGPRGNLVRVIIDGRSGDITGLRVIRWAKPRDHRHDRGRWDRRSGWDNQGW